MISLNLGKENIIKNKNIRDSIVWSLEKMIKLMIVNNKKQNTLIDDSIKNKDLTIYNDRWIRYRKTKDRFISHSTPTILKFIKIQHRMLYK